MVYKWKDSSRFAVKAQVAGETLASIRQANGGHLTPEAVVDASRDEDAPLHRCFEWDADQAQEKWNKHVARNVINSIVEVHVVPGEEEPRTILGYVHVKTADAGNCYMTTARVMSDEDLKEQAIGEALKYLAGAQARFSHLEELSGVFDAINRETKKLTKRRRRAAQNQVAAAS